MRKRLLSFFGTHTSDDTFFVSDDGGCISVECESGSGSVVCSASLVDALRAKLVEAEAEKQMYARMVCNN